MIRYILVDDQPKTLKYVKAKIDTLPKDYELKHVESYDSSKKAYENINKDDFDLLIVDFDMPVYNGIELAQKIGDNKKIIFLTGETEKEKQVINSLDISGYLSKPFDIEEFEAILKNKVIGKINKNNTFKKGERLSIAIGVNQDIGFCPDETCYISTSRNIKKYQSNKNCVHFFGEQDDVTVTNVRISINELSKKLEPYGFEKINQSTIVNLSKIDKRNNKELTLLGSEEEFTIGDNEKKGIVSRIRTLFGV
ncbi:LytR/AlgR family response regulator transcription factor [Psychroserpens sp. NJDZ02]|uniref:LytR/AlgR family response regulator transcription factor n=1 Tax=Psychroserpens sp. NJDZ02 TaxID=2570561 RepID=UPI0010A92D7A|nr:response regulator transcription factor [Psychroserpens sp. NJDZ02]QCE43322.1 response regulator transcription factor [Psychroserpens sp. NJDZ02]